MNRRPKPRAIRAGTICASLIIALAAFNGAPAMADRHDANRPGTITVSGTGSVVAVPDIAMISTGVVSEADTARAALD